MKPTEHTMSLDELTRKIAFHADKSDGHIIAAAQFFRQARERVKAGEAGDVKWEAWACKYIRLCPSRLRELQQIANADNPEAELRRLRKLNSNRQAKHRQKKRAGDWEYDANKRGLIEWVKKAPTCHVQLLFKEAQLLWQPR